MKSCYVFNTEEVFFSKEMLLLKMTLRLQMGGERDRGEFLMVREKL